MPKLNRWYLAVSVLVLLVAVCLRFYHFTARAPFDWDQNRDYAAVSSIAQGKFTLIGPVARGDGGFHLGPVYYYLLVPGYLATHGDPASLAVTAMVIDLFTILSVLLLLQRFTGKLVALAVGSIWAVSPFIVDWSRVSWNVVLLPLWTVFTLAAWSALVARKNWGLVALGALFGLAWHIHASLIPIIPVLAIFAIRFWPRDWRVYALAALASFIVYSPLFLFDLRHVWFNTHLIFETWASGQIVHAPWGVAAGDVVGKLGKNTLGIFTSNFRFSLPVGAAVLALSLFTPFLSPIYSGAGLILLTNVVLAVILRDPGFPEYYLAASFVPTILIYFGVLQRLLKNFATAIVASFFVIYLALHLTWSPLPFGLSVKQNLAAKLATLSPISLEFDLPPGREGGIIPLLTLQGTVLARTSPHHILVTDKQDGPLYISGELATDIVRIGGFRAAGVTSVK